MASLLKHARALTKFLDTHCMKIATVPKQKNAWKMQILTPGHREVTTARFCLLYESNLHVTQLATQPEYRDRGYARALQYAMTLHAIEHNAKHKVDSGYTDAGDTCFGHYPLVLADRLTFLHDKVTCVPEGFVNKYE